MLTTVQGIYRDGRIELAEMPGNLDEETPVIVTFLRSGYIDLRARGIDETQAADLRTRLSVFAEDWNSPKMDIYDETVRVALFENCFLPRGTLK